MSGNANSEFTNANAEQGTQNISVQAPGSVTNTTYGDHAQTGGSRNTYNAPVNQSTHSVKVGDHAQIGGKRTTYKGPTQIGGDHSQFGGDHSQVGGAHSQFGGPNSQFGGSRNSPNINIGGNADKSHFGQGNQTNN